MPGFNPKAVFIQAQKDEAEGLAVPASRKYAKIASYLLRRGKPEEAERLLKRAIQLNASAPRVYLEKALCEAHLNRGREAEESLSAFVKIAQQKRKMREYAVLVEAKLAAYPRLREKYFRLFLDQEAGEAGPYLGLARALIAQQGYTRAKDVLVDALRTGTRRGEVIGLMRQALEGLNQMEALFYLQQFEEGKISRPEMVLLLSEGRNTPRAETSVLGDEDLTRMVLALEKELGIDNQVESLLAEEWMPEFERQLMEQTEKDGALKVDLAVGCNEMGLTDCAIHLLASISKRDAHYWLAQSLSGTFYLSEGKDLLALPYFQNCLRYANPDSALAVDACYSLIQIYVRLGDVRRAWELSEQIKNRHANYREFKALREVIETKISEMKVAS